ncbi:acyl-CoA thioester hydrolase/BAAT C-terminal domain-containing protein [Sodalis sp. RH22]|uniref:acyl-CoA thioester hydrolase/BAAT C-terminal domain-containing protein n=1 Tax=unclassified Sodalis (in: enterobacteria) TaxID=2636512 RepID=UPI0039B42DDD
MMPLTLTVTPAIALVDEPRRIRLHGLRPGATVEIEATSRTGDGAAWRSYAQFIAADDGTVDLQRDAPVAGDYRGVDGQGLLWSQRQVSPPTGAAGHPAVIAPVTVHLRATGRSAGVDAAPVHTDAQMVQQFSADNVAYRPIEEQGLVGALYTPGTPGPHPVVIYLNGSGGGINHQRAALWASRGYAALALGYFGAPGLPSHISATPLEYFADALAWVHERLRPRKGFVAVSGQSRGGELSLLLAATFPERVSAVIAYVPSSVTHGVLAAGRPGESRFAPCWVYQGKPLPIVWHGNDAQACWREIDNAPQPRRQAASFVHAQRNTAAVEAARIRVENMRCPVLLISGGDDGFWPSTDYCRHVTRTLNDHAYPYPVQHLDYPDAGHAIATPYVPATVIDKPHAVSGIIMAAGGTPAANAHASADSWHHSLAFMAKLTQSR